MRNSFYEMSLYPLQDTILARIEGLNLPLYLTGGTALSRHYLDHRYSVDLDLFANCHPDFRSVVDAIDEAFHSNQISCRSLARSADFVRLEIIGKNDIRLKLDLVNDLVCHIGGYELSGRLGKVDNVFNIMSNKISAIPRMEIKDFADIICIARKYEFSWKSIISQAMQKDAWVNPLDLARYFWEVDANRFEIIQWITPIKPDLIRKYCEILVDEIVRGSDNSLVDLG